MDIYTRFFEAINPSFLFESIYVNSYYDLDCYIIKEKKSVIVLFKDLKGKGCQEEAVSLFENTKRFNEFYDEFKVFLQNSHENSKKLVNNNQLIDLIDLFLNFLKFYRYTEAFYTELSYKVLNKNNNENLKKNLSLLEEIKNEARKYLNSFFSGQESYLSQIINKNEDSQFLWNSSVEELRKGIKPSIEDIEKRKSNHILDRNNIIYNEESSKFKEIKEWKDSLNELTTTLKGTAASKGKTTGKAFVLSSDFTNFDKLDDIITQMPNDIILVSETTAPDIIKACFKAKAIVTNQGGLGSHAAIISRELKIPCVVGCKIATKVIKTGDNVTVDGDKGVVIINEK